MNMNMKYAVDISNLALPSWNLISIMEPASSNIDEPQQNDLLFFSVSQFRKLGHQRRSLQELIEKDLNFQNEESTETAAVHLR